MTIDHEQLRFGGLVLAAIGIPVLLGIILGLPAVLCAALVIVLLAVVALLEVRRRARPELAVWPERAPLPPAHRPAPATVALVEVPLDSDTEDYRFRFSATVSWLPTSTTVGDSHADPGALAKTAIIDRSAAISRDVPLSDAVLARHRIAAALGSAEIDGTGQVRAWATDIVLDVHEQDAERIAALANLRKSALVWEHERGHERDIRRYLGDEVLKTTGSALVWWLARHTERVEDAVALIGHLARLSAVAQGREVPVLSADADLAQDAGATAADGPDGAPTELAGFIDGLFPPDDARRLLFARDLARTLEDFGLSEPGGQVRATFGVPEVDGDARSGTPHAN